MAAVWQAARLQSLPWLRLVLERADALVVVDPSAVPPSRLWVTVDQLVRQVRS